MATRHHGAHHGCRGFRGGGGWCFVRALARALFILLALAPAAHARLEPGNVLLLYNSRNGDSLAVRDAYIAARPRVVQLDLNSFSLNVTSISRADYLALVRDPVRAFINGASGGPDLSRQIIAIATTRGLPARVLSPSGSADEFQLFSAWASLESELTLLQQNLEASGSAYLTQRYRGAIDNPYHRLANDPIAAFSRDGVRINRPFTAVPISDARSTPELWSIDGLSPGDMYLVCRLDSSASAGASGTSALDNVRALIARSLALSVDRCAVGALLDEYAAPPPPQGFEFDEGDVPPLVEGPPDFERTAAFLRTFGVSTLHDETFNFVTGAELPAPPRPLLVFGTYGENHNLNNWGEQAPGVAAYLPLYSFHPAAAYIAYESFNGTSLFAPTFNRGQQQAADFIALGGSFTIAHVMEPFAYAIPDIELLAPNLYQHGLSFAEAAWSAIPVLSWPHTPLGDPLARVRVLGVPLCKGDSDFDGSVGFPDITETLRRFGTACTTTGTSLGDADGDGFVGFPDVTETLRRFGTTCPLTP